MRYRGTNIREALEGSVNEDQRMGRWSVADSYDVRHTTDGKRYIVAPYDWPSGSAPLGWERYRPLISHPHLFLEFARSAEKMDGYAQPEVYPGSTDTRIRPSFLPETDNNTEIALWWAETFGVLGLGGERGDPDPLGGEKDTVGSFCEEAIWAHRVLSLYEAATDPDEVNADFIARDAEDPFEQDAIVSNGGYARQYAVKEVMMAVELAVRENCSPTLYRDGDRIVQGWGFYSLLGAMWLQMMWLVTSKDVPRRCAGPGCNRIISYAQPQKPWGWNDQDIDPWKKNDRSRGYRTRKDKICCSDNCRVKKWQHKQKSKRRA